MADHLDITVHTAAAESQWSNGVVERNNQTLAHMMGKIIAETNTSPDLALTWALNAKNSPRNTAGFSPFQLVHGFNPKLLASLSDELPTCTINKIIITDSSRKPKCHTQCTCCIHCL